MGFRGMRFAVFASRACASTHLSQKPSMAARSARRSARRAIRLIMHEPEERHQLRATDLRHQACAVEGVQG
jgi:hypothetical protein